MKFKKVLRYDRRARLLRVFRVMWRRGTIGDGKGYSAKLSLALQPKLFDFYRYSGSCDDVFLCLAGLRWHYQRAYGGIHV